MNQLYFGDCLDVLKQLHAEFPPFIDLIYIDPPFNSKRNYNVLFESIDMKDATAQKQAFADTWSNVMYLFELNGIAELNKDLHDVLSVFNKSKSISDSAVAYLTTMSIRIWYMHKLLKDTGSFYLHCDASMSHYLKLVCDIIFGDVKYRNEIIWKRSDAHNDSKQGAKHFGRVHDVILFYAKSEKATFNTQYTPLPESTVNNWYKHIDEITGKRYNKADVTGPGGASKGNPCYEWNGHLKYWRYSKEKMQQLHNAGKLVYSKSGMPYQKRFLDESKGVSLQDIWDDIQMLRGLQEKGERLGYPTQKPEALLERIIKTSSNEGDVVADFFCGCGTTIAAAQKLNRKWLGVDISHLAIRLILQRLTKSDGPSVKDAVKLHGFPKDVDSARMLARETDNGRFGFQEWVIEVLLHGVVNPKKVADGGYDGYMTYLTDKGKEFVLIETKSGHVNVKNIREFIQVVNKQNAAAGIFVCFEDSVTKEMLKEAKAAGQIAIGEMKTSIDKVQILTVDDMINHGKQPHLPNIISTFKQAERKQGKRKAASLFDE